ncbi:cation diffusion facilitator family transporter [Paenisporosarcina cavernae]|uniref:Cation transporter n=1 Tax=Paenisporosarcina cavernae TaxID=2320858 RepID=A0A385YSZ8_9BACL|nr:cation diffusion facilitator family transporter [Paenisporosarcina cavernae]AYC29929.1 cation transporter [Paenisporosarcina cavernae]
MKEFFVLLKDGNKPSLLAAIINTVIAILKGVAFFFTGNVAMFAEMLHSFGDAANQLFVYIGSALSKKAPTKRFPNGFGRLVNLVLLFAVIIVGILAYEAIIEGWHHVIHPTESEGLWIIVGVFSLAAILEFSVLYKAGKEVLHETNTEGTGFAPIIKSFSVLSKAKPATKLVFMEDLVATSGNILALIAVFIAHYTGFLAAEGYASIIIGILMFYVVGRIFLDNARGVLGETDEQMTQHIARLVMEHEAIQDIKMLSVVKEGEFLHVEVMAEVDSTLSFAEVDDIRDHLVDLILHQPNVQDVHVSFDEDDGVMTWDTAKQNATDFKKNHPEMK